MAEEDLRDVEGGAETENEVVRTFFQKYKLHLIIGITLLLLAVVAWFFLLKPEISKKSKGEAPKELGQEAPKELDQEPLKEPEPEALKDFPKTLNAIVYRLEPFLLPIKTVGEEQDRFVNIKLFFVLSNRKLDGDLGKNIQTIRQNIYTLLKRKKPGEYFKYKTRVKEQLKREIITVSNAFLPSGSGSILDVLFTEFVIK